MSGSNKDASSRRCNSCSFKTASGSESYDCIPTLLASSWHLMQDPATRKDAHSRVYAVSQHQLPRCSGMHDFSQHRVTCVADLFGHRDHQHPCATLASPSFAPSQQTPRISDSRPLRPASSTSDKSVSTSWKSGGNSRASLHQPNSGLGGNGHENLSMNASAPSTSHSFGQKSHSHGSRLDVSLPFPKQENHQRHAVGSRWGVSIASSGGTSLQRGRDSSHQTYGSPYSSKETKEMIDNVFFGWDGRKELLERNDVIKMRFEFNRHSERRPHFDFAEGSTHDMRRSESRWPTEASGGSFSPHRMQYTRQNKFKDMRDYRRLQGLQRNEGMSVVFGDLVQCQARSTPSVTPRHVFSVASARQDVSKNFAQKLNAAGGKPKNPPLPSQPTISRGMHSHKVNADEEYNFQFNQSSEEAEYDDPDGSSGGESAMSFIVEDDEGHPSNSRNHVANSARKKKLSMSGKVRRRSEYTKFADNMDNNGEGSWQRSSQSKYKRRQKKKAARVVESEDEESSANEWEIQSTANTRAAKRAGQKRMRRSQIDDEFFSDPASSENSGSNYSEEYESMQYSSCSSNEADDHEIDSVEPDFTDDSDFEVANYQTPRRNKRIKSSSFKLTDSDHSLTKFDEENDVELAWCAVGSEEALYESANRSRRDKRKYIFLRVEFQGLTAPIGKLRDKDLWLERMQLLNERKEKQKELQERREAAVVVDGLSSLPKNSKGSARCQGLQKACKGIRGTHFWINSLQLELAISEDNRVRMQRQQSAIAAAAHGRSSALSYDSALIKEKAVIVQRSYIHNMGLFIAEDVEAGDQIIEYKGELIREKVSDVREKRYELSGHFMFYFFQLGSTAWVVDAMKAGGAARFANHSCDSNSAVKPVGKRGQTIKLVMYAKRALKSGDEITLDYMVKAEDRIPCLCKSKNCTGFMN